MFREIRVDLDAVRHNIATIKQQVAPTRVLAVVKANAYGHGAVPVARAALEGGADALGVVDLTEAVELREAGIDAPLLSWFHAPDEDFSRAAEHGIEVAVSYAAQLEAVARAELPSVQIKLDTGLSRNGVPADQWSDVFSRAAELQASGGPRVSGLMSHLSGTSVADDLDQVAEFERAVALARSLGLDPEFLHIAATGAALDLPQARMNQVRIGIGTYGLTPYGDERTSADLGLRPAMRVSARVSLVKRVPAGSGLSYGFLYRTERETTLALVPIGYADGVPRLAVGAPVAINGRTYHVDSRVAMDQFIVDVGDDPVEIGDEAVLFGNPECGEPAAESWARAAGTINYEVVTRMGHRPVHTYVGEGA